MCFVFVLAVILDLLMMVMLFGFGLVVWLCVWVCFGGCMVFVFLFG